MSNRLQALLFLIIFFWIIWLFIYYLFFFNNWNLEISVWKLTWVKIQMKSEYNINYTSVMCNNYCKISNIPAINYEIQAELKDYNTIIQNIKIKKNETLKLNLIFKKNIILNNFIDISNKEKIQISKYSKLLQEKEESNTWTNNDILWIKNDNLYFYKNDPYWSIYAFDKNNQIKIFSLTEELIKKIIFNKNDWLIVIIWKNNYLFNINDNSNNPININENIVYIKKTNILNKFIIKTDKWSYLYDIQNKSSIKNILFNDFINYKWNQIIWLINKNDSIKNSILNLENNNKDKLILHNINTREKKLIYEIDKDINYIELIWDNLVITDNQWEKFELQNLEY